MANEQLNVSKGAIVKEINGVKYFRLQSKYAGDYTKNCGLLGNEIDENFYFLRSNDIANMTLDKDKNLILTRVDGDTLKVNIAEEIGKYTFRFNKATGNLVIVYPDGTQQVLGGFLVEGKDIKVASDATLDGDGTILNPLSLSEVEKTGTYSPAQYFLDLTSGNTMPEGATLGKGFRIVTKEKIDTFGLLYNYYNLFRIRKALLETGSPWRVPSDKDWADLLNAAEYCDEDRTHNTDCVNEWTGKHAGARAKSTNLWIDTEREEEGYPTKGEDNLPSTGSMGTFKVLPVGLGEGSRGPISRKTYNHDIEGFKKLAGFWSTTEVNNIREHDCSSTPNVYTRTFSHDTRMVLRESSKPLSRLSVRLVKDYDVDHMELNEYENILGYNMPTVLISNPETNYSKVWTSINVGFKEFSGITSEEWQWASDSDKGVKEVYYINEWTGAKWEKKQMVAGDSVVILDYDNDPSTSGDTYHEWRVYEDKNGKQTLVDTLDALKDEFKEEFEELNNKIDTVCGVTVSLSAATVETKNNVDSLSASTLKLSATTVELKKAVDELSGSSAGVKKAITEISASTIALSGKVKDVQDELDSTQKGAGLNEDGSYSDNGESYLSGGTSIHEALDNLAKMANAKDINSSASYVFTVNPASAETANAIETNDGTKIPFSIDLDFGER